MKNIITYRIRIGILLVLIGSIILSISIIMFRYHVKGFNIEDNVLRAIGIAGCILIIMGIIFCLKALNDGYIKPIKHLIYIHSHPQFSHGHPINVFSQNIRCKNCKRQIPMEINFYPYCGQSIS